MHCFHFTKTSNQHPNTPMDYLNAFYIVCCRLQCHLWSTGGPLSRVSPKLLQVNHLVCLIFTRLTKQHPNKFSLVFHNLLNQIICTNRVFTLQIIPCKVNVMFLMLCIHCATIMDEWVTENLHRQIFRISHRETDERHIQTLSE